MEPRICCFLLLSFLLRRLGSCALRLAVLSRGGFAAPGGVVAQSRGAVEVVFVVQAVGGVVLGVLQTRDQALILVPEFAAHQGRLAHHHHVLEGGAERADFKKKRKRKLERKELTNCLGCGSVLENGCVTFSTFYSPYYFNSSIKI